MGATTIWIDTETGGTEPHHPTIQVAAIAERDWLELATLEVKIRFDVAKAEPDALALNHFDAAIWEREALPEVTAVEDLAAFFRDHATVEKLSKRTGRPYRVARLAGHNLAGFDGPRLVEMFKRHGAFMPAAAFEPLDTMHLSRWYALGQENPPASAKLGDLCAHFGIQQPAAHDALGDVRSCIAVARRMLEATT